MKPVHFDPSYIKHKHCLRQPRKSNFTSVNSNQEHMDSLPERHLYFNTYINILVIHILELQILNDFLSQW